MAMAAQNDKTAERGTPPYASPFKAIKSSLPRYQSPRVEVPSQQRDVLEVDGGTTGIRRCCSETTEPCGLLN